jgi:hypothetical protein
MSDHIDQAMTFRASVVVLDNMRSELERIGAIQRNLTTIQGRHALPGREKEVIQQALIRIDAFEVQYRPEFRSDTDAQQEHRLGAGAAAFSPHMISQASIRFACGHPRDDCCLHYIFRCLVSPVIAGSTNLNIDSVGFLL